ncbi:MAG TPA: hypothetical protein VGK73_32980, partial [Polyangiaceae bacterium]
GDVLGWRWTPAVALVGGSLLFVLLAVTLVPDDLGEGLAAPGAKTRSSAPQSSASGVPGYAAMPSKGVRPLPHHGATGRQARRLPGIPSPAADHVVESTLGARPELPPPLPEDAPPPEPPAAMAPTIVTPPPSPPEAAPVIP